MSSEGIMGEPLPFDEKIVPPGYSQRVVDPEAYFAFHRTSVADVEAFWGRVAEELEWFKKWEKVMVPGEYPNVYRWFVGAETNISYLCLDRHVRTWRRNKVAIIWEGEPVDEKGNPKERRVLTYFDLWRLVNRIAFALRRLGVRRGSRVAIYMPMIPELPAVMLACARLGAVFTVVFSGFTSENLAVRMRDLGARFLITADGFYRRGRVIELKKVADEAVNLYDGIEKVVVVRRLMADVPMKEGRDLFLDELLAGVPANAYVEPERMTCDEPLYVLYTSGTTGKPKGVVHDHHGYSVLLHATMKWVFDIRDDDVYYCTADIGWVTGHSYIVFGPLMEGATVVMYEGTPDYPAPDRWWAIVERYGVTILYTTPTAVRMLIRFGDEHVKRHDLSTLRLIHSVGEPINPSAWRWLYEVVGGKRCPVGSTWWQTETGGILISHTPGFMLVPLKPGTNGPPLPGIEVDVVDEQGRPLPPGSKGFLAIKKPWPGMPAPPTGLWGDPEGYNRIYWSRYPGIYYTGDYAVRDKDGYIWVAGRADEVLKVAGHRIGTYELESALVAHGAVAESAVVGVPDEVKGEAPVAFVVLKSGHQPSEELKADLVRWIRERYGPILVPKEVVFVRALPKTRSGKIMRRLLRAVLMGAPLGDVTTLEDEATVEEVKAAYEELKRQIR
ncbi:MAG: acetate--CoA ligase [Candidatus Calditenuis sp.]|nr:acetate--CoA ligase [Candidatus Calditenuis sp.]